PPRDGPSAVAWLRNAYAFAGMPHEWDATEAPGHIVAAGRDRAAAVAGTAPRDIIQTLQVQAAYMDLAAALHHTHVSRDNGVSFGLPIVANIAAKLKLLNRDLTANQLKRILVDTSDLDEALKATCIAGGVVNPLRAYFAALDGEVTTRGEEPHVA